MAAQPSFCNDLSFSDLTTLQISVSKSLYDMLLNTVPPT